MGDNIDEESKVPAENKANPESAYQLSEPEIARLLQENADLRARVKELEADKQYFKDQIDFHLRRQTAAVPQPSVPSDTYQTHAQSRTADQPQERSTHVTDPPPAQNSKKKKTEFVPRKIESAELLDVPPDLPYRDVEAEFPTRDPHAHMRMRQVMKVIFGLVVVSGIVFWIQYGFNSSTDNENTIAQTVAASDGETTSGRGSNFDRFLARSSIAQLVNESIDLTPDVDEPFAVRLERYQKQIAISDRLLKLDPNEKDRRFAIRYKLKAMIETELINLEQNVTNPQQSQILLDCGIENSASSDPLISNLALVADLTARVSAFLNEESAEKRAMLKGPAVESFLTVANRTQNDRSTASRIYRLLQIINARNQINETGPFIDAFLAAYRNSSDATITRLVNSLKTVQVDRRFVDPEQGPISDRPSLVKELMEQIHNVFNQGSYVSDQTIFVALQRGNTLLRLGRPKEAKQLVSSIDNQETVGRSFSTDLKRIKSGLQLFDSPLDISCINDFDGRQAEFRIESATHKVLYFASSVNYQQSVNGFNELVNNLGQSLLHSKSVEVVLVYMDQGDNPQALGSIQKFAQQSQYWQVWFLNTTTEEGQSFLSRVPVVKTPYIVVLNEDNYVISLDPAVTAVGEIIYAQ